MFDGEGDVSVDGFACYARARLCQHLPQPMIPPCTLRPMFQMALNRLTMVSILPYPFVQSRAIRSSDLAVHRPCNLSQKRLALGLETQQALLSFFTSKQTCP